MKIKKDTLRVQDEEEEEEDWAIQYAKHCEEKEKEFFETYKTKEM